VTGQGQAKARRNPACAALRSSLIVSQNLEPKGARLLRYLTLIVVILGAMFTADPPRAQAQGVVTFKFTNSARYTIYIRMFSQNRAWSWPGGDRAFVLDDRLEHSFLLECRVGEKICYGGSYRTGDGDGFWGVGVSGKRGCTSCCLRCGTDGEDVWASWDLSE
jgi:hypothetical protein